MKTLPLSVAVLVGISVCASAANPFLAVSDNRPVSAKFSGSEWGEQIKGDEAPLSATVVTRRIARMNWGAVFELRFDQIRSRTKPPREIQPVFFVVTDERIYLLNEEDNFGAAQRLAQLGSPPRFEEDSVYGISAGTFTHSDPPWETKVTLKGNTCTYSSEHNSGHFKTVVWRRGVGLMAYASGSGARADGFRLKRVAR